MPIRAKAYSGAETNETTQTSEMAELISFDTAQAWRESGLDETLAETFPCSDPLSTIPNPPAHY